MTTKVYKKMQPEDVDWYQLSVRQRMSPFPNYMSMKGITKDMAEAFGKAYRRVLLFFKENMLYAFMDRDDYEQMGNYALEYLQQNPQFYHQMVELITKKGNEFVQWVQSITAGDISQYTDQQLTEFHQEYEQRYRFIYSHYFTILAVERKLAEYLKEYLHQKVEDLALVEDYFSVLITEPRAQVAGKENHAALKLAKKIVENEKWNSYFAAEDVQEVEQKVKADQELNQLFIEHEENYFWITRDYEDPVLTYNDFISRMTKMLKENPLQELAKKKAYLQNVDKRIKNLEEKLSINKKYAQLFTAMREGINLKELRKMYVSLTLYYYDAIIKEIAKRTFVSLKALRHIQTEELLQLFADQQFADQLNQRIRLSVYYIEDGECETFTGERADQLFEKLCAVKDDVQELKGLPASPGTARGLVRIVMHPEELHKVQPGDILVSGQIVPSFAPALKLAVGLICDGGTGITSHPAILAREAGIPAITSTNVATKVLKDGEIVEVDGNKGIVRRVNK